LNDTKSSDISPTTTRKVLKPSMTQKPGHARKNSLPKIVLKNSDNIIIKENIINAGGSSKFISNEFGESFKSMQGKFFQDLRKSQKTPEGKSAEEGTSPTKYRFTKCPSANDFVNIFKPKKSPDLSPQVTEKYDVDVDKEKEKDNKLRINDPKKAIPQKFLKMRTNSIQMDMAPVFTSKQTFNKSSKLLFQVKMDNAPKENTLGLNFKPFAEKNLKKNFNLTKNSIKE